MYYTYLSLLLCRKICRRTEAPGVWVDCFDKSIFTVQVVLSKGTAGIQCDSSVVRRQCDTTLHTILKIQTCRTSRLNYKSSAGYFLFRKSALSPSSIYSRFIKLLFLLHPGFKSWVVANKFLRAKSVNSYYFKTSVHV